MNTDVERPSMQERTAWPDPAHDAAIRAIIEALERVGRLAGYRPEEIFRDWLKLVETALDALPACPVLLERVYGPDSVEQMIKGALYGEENRRSRLPAPARYGRDEVFTHFAAATEALLRSSLSGYQDVLGSAYMLYASLDKYTAQYFTPWNVARLMARMTIIDGQEQILHRLQDAAERGAREDPAIEALLLSGSIAALTRGEADRQAERLFFEQFLPALKPYYRPLTVLDPCVGSGILLLAGAAQFPDWAVHYGWVQWFGMDIDPTCVTLARLNFRLYGLNGWGWQHSMAQNGWLKCALSAAETELAALPEPAQSTYRALRDAHQAGDEAAARAIREQVEAGRAEMAAQQMTLFGGDV